MTATKIDWLSYRTKAEIPAVIAGLRDVFGEFGGKVSTMPRKGGWMGFEQAADLSIDRMKVGMMAYGGTAQKGWVTVNLTGKGCDWVPDWQVADEVLADQEHYQARRVDIALDTCHREVTHESMVAAYRDGQFSIYRKPPTMKQILSDEGSTVYIGKRDQGKFLRGYQKGYELIKNFPAGSVTQIDGIPIEDFYRVELELKAKGAPLPADLIENRDSYFAGSYPYLQTLIEAQPVIFKQGRERDPQRNLAAALENIRRQYGPTIYTALAAYGGDVGAVWDQIIGMRHSDELVEAGVLLVDHV